MLHKAFVCICHTHSDHDSEQNHKLNHIRGELVWFGYSVTSVGKAGAHLVKTKSSLFIFFWKKNPSKEKTSVLFIFNCVAFFPHTFVTLNAKRLWYTFIFYFALMYDLCVLC